METLSASATQKFSESPERDAVERIVTVGKHNCPPAKIKGQKCKNASGRCLIIGFDTEYQAIRVDRCDEHEGGIKNDLLSYQYCVSLVEENKQAEAETEAEVSGIIPIRGKPRWRLQDFVVAALGAFVEAHPEIILPEEIYLVGHFTRADLPGFADFQELAKGALSNLRNTFVSFRCKQALSVVSEDGEVIGNFSFVVRDTILLAPGSAKSLATIGEIIGYKKITLDQDPVKERKIKENMESLMFSYWPLFRDYAIRDAEVCVRYFKMVLRQYQTILGKFRIPITLTSFGTSLVMEDWKAKGWDTVKLLGHEKVYEKVYNRRLGYFVKKSETPMIDVLYHEEPFAIECYHGGRNEQFMFGPGNEATWNDFDLSSAYTTAMSVIGKPSWQEITPLKEVGTPSLTDLSYFLVDFEFPMKVRFPSLPVRTANGLIFPRKGRSYCCGPEILAAQNQGATLKFVRGCSIPCDHSQPIFHSFIKQCIEKRSEYKRGTFQNLFWKEVGNSTYGKTAQGLRRKRAYDLRADDMAKIPESKLTQPFLAAFITSYTRAVLGELMNSLSPAIQVFSVTTDGFLSTASREDINIALSGPLASSFKAARVQLVGDENVMEVKHTVARPIGWRTRGSATLLPKDGSEGVVLQKGGIKTNDCLDLDEQNKFIIDLFLNRKPGDTFTQSVGISVRDMMNGDTDFIHREQTKKLSMEFDWKRRPMSIRDESFDFNGKEWSHVAFQSDPLESVEEFEALRRAWEKSNRPLKTCLKTKADVDRFLAMAETEKAPEDVRRFLKRKDGDLNRLKQCLCRAFKHKKAGFEKCEDLKGHITHRAFCDILNAYNLNCRITDLENANRADFTSHQAIKTERANFILNSLISNEFPFILEREFWSTNENTMQ